MKPLPYTGCIQFQGGGGGGGGGGRGAGGKGEGASLVMPDSDPWDGCFLYTLRKHAYSNI